MNDMTSWHEDDDLFRRLRALIAHRIATVGVEASMRERDKIEKDVAAVTKKELEYARARVLDYLLFYRSWIEQDLDAAANNPRIRQAMLRGDLIHAALHKRDEKWTDKLRGFSPFNVTRASGIMSNWRQLADKGQ